MQSRWADLHLLACQDWRAVVGVLLAPVDGMHQCSGAMVYCGYQLALLVGIFNQAPQLWVEGPIPCDAMATCIHGRLSANNTKPQCHGGQASVACDEQHGHASLTCCFSFTPESSSHIIDAEHGAQRPCISAAAVTSHASGTPTKVPHREMLKAPILWKMQISTIPALICIDG